VESINLLLVAEIKMENSSKSNGFNRSPSIPQNSTDMTMSKWKK
jgi:hypothetical protein